MRLTTLIGGFDDDAETHPAATVVESPNIQTPGRFISTMTSARSAGARVMTSTVPAVGTGLPSRASTVNRWPGRPADVFGCARIEQAKQDALAFADANRFPVTEHPVVEGCGGIHDLEAVIRRWPFAKVLHTDPTALPMVRGEQHLLS